ncbi:SOS response-associated peptidase [Ruania albidiflava]|uniref:SOS response-associated peptidase n=1 Tax=Ruania albidiflava TaxID=366586 RepID=UPI0003B3F756|nr:SOS response-associated peptidase [Ruania albidiflava]
MCGRYASFREAQDLADAFDVEEISEAARQAPASYNVAPTDGVRMIIARTPKATSDGAASPAQSSSPAQGGTTGDGAASPAQDGAPAEQVVPARREMHLARWGLVPGWAKDLSIGSRMFNARSDSLATKRSFAPSLANRRCLVVADGYYEWLKEEVPGQSKPRRTPFYIHRTDGAPLAFAGLYAWWPDPSKEKGDPDRWVLSATIVTADARGGLEQIHDREPVVLAEDEADAWLTPDLTGADEALAVLEQPSPALSWYEVSARVGSVRNNDPSLIEPV